MPSFGKFASAHPLGRLLRLSPSPFWRTSVAVAVGTAQGAGYAGVAAVLHRAMHAGTSLPTQSTSTASIEAGVRSSALPALRRLNAQLVRRLTARIRAGPAGMTCEPRESTVLKAFRNCAVLGQGGLVLDLYAEFHAAQRTALSSHAAAQIIDCMGSLWQHSALAASGQGQGLGAEMSNHRDWVDGDGTCPHATLRVALQVARQYQHDAEHSCTSQRSRGGGAAGANDSGGTLVGESRIAVELDGLEVSSAYGANPLEPGELMRAGEMHATDDRGGGEAARRTSVPVPEGLHPLVLNALLRTCALSGDVDRAAALYWQGREHGSGVFEQKTLGVFLEALCSAGRVDAALGIWIDSSASGLRVQPRTLQSLIKACGDRRGGWAMWSYCSSSTPRACSPKAAVPKWRSFAPTVSAALSMPPSVSTKSRARPCCESPAFCPGGSVSKASS